MLFVGALFYTLWSRRPQPVEPDPTRYELSMSGPIMGTTFAVTIITAAVTTEAEDATYQSAVLGSLNAVNDTMSTWKEDSELSRLNRHASTEPFPLSPDTVAVLRAAHTVSTASGGAFDVTIKPLVNLWKFGSDAMEWESSPSNADIALYLGRVGYTQLTVTDDAVQKSLPELTVDLGAIAKGYSVDKVGRALEAEGITDYLVEVGGEVRARGTNGANAPWRIGIEQPDALLGSVQALVGLPDMSLATSGDYRNYYEDEDGQRISHTIDARNGRPITHALASVSVIHEDAIMADAWATALSVLGPDEGMAMAEEQGLPVLMLVRDGAGEFITRASANFDAYRVTQ
jgi:thiamine biosynthesis lipoprotein